MPSTFTLDPRAQFFEGEFKRAWDFFDDEFFDAANNIARKLLLEPALGRLHRAGCHLLLAHGPDEYVRHAEEAVKLYESLYEGELGKSREDGGPSERQKKSRLTMIEGAKNVLSQAHKDAAEEVPMTDEDFLQQFKEQGGFEEDIAEVEEELKMEAETEVWLDESRAKVKAKQEAEAAAKLVADVDMIDIDSSGPAQTVEEPRYVVEREVDASSPLPTPPSSSKKSATTW